MTSEFLQAGSFNVRMALEAPVSSDDGCGGVEVEWTLVTDVWVRLVPVSGILISKANDLRQQLTHWIYLRHSSQILPGHRFVKSSRIFSIETVRDPDETGRYLVCEAKEQS